MKRESLSRWALAGTLAFGVGAAVLPAAAQPRREVVVVREDRMYAEPVRLKDIPRPAYNKIEDVKGKDDVINTYRVHVAGRDNFRCMTKHKGHDRVILVSEDGQLLNVEDLRGDDLDLFRRDPNTWLHDYDERVFGRYRYYAHEAERVRGTPEHPEEIRIDEVPGAARATLFREAAGDRGRLEHCLRYRDNQGNVIYQCNIPDEPGNPRSVHMVQVLPDGRIFNEADFNNRGQRLEDWRPRTLAYDDLPRDVRDSVDRESPRGRISHVDVARRGGREIYTVQIDERDRTRYVTMDDRGHILNDVSERYDVERR
jgi:hypothetical protein